MNSIGARARDEVLSCHDLLVRILVYASTPSDLGRCAAVNRAFQAATEMAGGMFAARTWPVAAALQQSGGVDLGRRGLGLRIARAFAIPSFGAQASQEEESETASHRSSPPPFPLDDYTLLIQVRDARKHGVVCFSSSGKLTANVLRREDELVGVSGQGVQRFDSHVEGQGLQRFVNQVDSAEDAESDSFWNDFLTDTEDYLDKLGADLHDEGEVERVDCTSDGFAARDVGLIFADSMELYVVLVRRSDGAVHQLVHGGHVNLEDDLPIEERFCSFYLDQWDESWGPRRADTLMCFFDMLAEDSEGAPWKYIRLEMSEPPEHRSRVTADDLAHALSALKPWI